MKLKVVLRRDSEDGGYVATCPALPGCGESVLIDIRDVNTNALIWRGGFTNLAACP